MTYNSNRFLKEPGRLIYLKANVLAFYPGTTASSRMRFINAYDAWKIEIPSGKTTTEDLRSAIKILQGPDSPKREVGELYDKNPDATRKSYQTMTDLFKTIESYDKAMGSKKS
jgi:hypothetical protein